MRYMARAVPLVVVVIVAAAALAAAVAVAIAFEESLLGPFKSEVLWLGAGVGWARFCVSCCVFSCCLYPYALAIGSPTLTPFALLDFEATYQGTPVPMGLAKSRKEACCVHGCCWRDAML